METLCYICSTLPTVTPEKIEVEQYVIVAAMEEVEKGWSALSKLRSSMMFQGPHFEIAWQDEYSMEWNPVQSHTWMKWK